MQLKEDFWMYFLELAWKKFFPHPKEPHISCLSQRMKIEMYPPTYDRMMDG
jgi:hypothetical protein